MRENGPMFMRRISEAFRRDAAVMSGEQGSGTI